MPGLIQLPKLSAHPRVTHAFTTREGGTSAAPYDSLNLALNAGDSREAVKRNRALVLEAMGRPDASWVSLRQVHGADIVQVTALAGRSIEADGLWTRDRNAALAVLVADCVPVLMTDRDGTLIAAVHAGWRGTRAKIVSVMVDRLKNAGTPPESLIVAMGPAIAQSSFEVGPEVADALRAAFPDAGDAVRAGAGDRSHADLWALNESALVASGVPREAIEVLRLDTVSQAELFSHRGDEGETGRQAGVIAFAR